MSVGGHYARHGKRILDVFLVSLAMLVLWPLMLAVALGVRLSSPGPALFVQKRVGRNGQAFSILKFRSMPVSTGDIASGDLGQVKIGRFGQFIRRTNLDELPQLINIFAGDMSLIGPRPPLASQADLVTLREANGAIRCRPGLTGLAQINSFDGMSAQQKAQFDGRYAASITLRGDLMILLKTFGYLAKPPPKY
jgi:O-antigen biosynthesis protein WbqP